tara:strand:- start:4577 stop:4966 length:390 start_codon:yes stop_codon:yes gene_type:complete
MPPTTRSTSRKLHNQAPYIDDQAPLDQVPYTHTPGQERRPYMCLQTIVSRQARRAVLMSDPSWAWDRESAALKVVEGKEQVSSIAWLLAVTARHRISMSKQDLQHLHMALNAGAGMVEQWMLERGWYPK